MLLLLAVGLAGAWWWFTAAKAPSTPPAPSQAAASPPPVPAAYVDNQLCLGCHQDQGRQWQQSHHAQAMAAPTEQTVRGDFNNTMFKHQGVTTRFFKRGDKFMVRTDGPDGKLADFEVSYTFGVAAAAAVLDRLAGRAPAAAADRVGWRAPPLVPPAAAREGAAGDVLHWTGRYQTGNTMCIGCHTTGFEKRYDAAADTFASRWTEPNVSCQSCHGPGQRHVQWAQGRQQGQAAPDLAGERHGLPVDLSKMGGAQQVEVCAPCHSRRSELTASHVPGQPRLDHFLPSLLTQRLYHADGQQLDEVYVDGSFRQSKMYQKGVGCTALPRRAHRQGSSSPATRCACSATRRRPTPRFRRSPARQAPSTRRHTTSTSRARPARRA